MDTRNNFKSWWRNSLLNAGLRFSFVSRFCLVFEEGSGWVLSPDVAGFPSLESLDEESAFRRRYRLPAW